MIEPRLLEILQHALGVDQYGRGEQNRNHFCAGGDDVPNCAELVALGLMRSFRRTYLPYFNCVVTELGKAEMLVSSPKPPKLSRSQQRYRAFLDADSGESFGEYIRRKRVR